MAAEITIKINISPEGTVVSQVQPGRAEGEVPMPPSLAEPEAMAEGEILPPPSVEELEEVAEVEAPATPPEEKQEATEEESGAQKGKRPSKQ